MTDEQFNEEIKRLEKERDRNLSIKCKYVVARIQRQINQLRELHKLKIKLNK